MTLPLKEYEIDQGVGYDRKVVSGPCGRLFASRPANGGHVITHLPTGLCITNVTGVFLDEVEAVRFIVEVEARLGDDFKSAKTVGDIDALRSSVRDMAQDFETGPPVARNLYSRQSVKKLLPQRDREWTAEEWAESLINQLVDTVDEAVTSMTTQLAYAAEYHGMKGQDATDFMSDYIGTVSDIAPLQQSDFPALLKAALVANHKKG